MKYIAVDKLIPEAIFSTYIAMKHVSIQSELYIF